MSAGEHRQTRALLPRAQNGGGISARHAPGRPGPAPCACVSCPHRGPTPTRARGARVSCRPRAHTSLAHARLLPAPRVHFLPHTTCSARDSCHTRRRTPAGPARTRVSCRLPARAPHVRVGPVRGAARVSTAKLRRNARAKLGMQKQSADNNFRVTRGQKQSVGSDILYARDLWILPVGAGLPSPIKCVVDSVCRLLVFSPCGKERN